MCNFSVLSSFISLQGIFFRPRFMDTIQNICYQKNILLLGLLESMLSVFLLPCVSRCSLSILNHFNAQDEKNRTSKEKDWH